jgi:membrane protease YdiL (CAAX protease family)
MTPEPDAPAIDGDAPAARPRRRVARWRPSRALAGVIVALLVSQAVALATQLAAGDSDRHAWAIATSVVLADLALVALIVVLAARGAERLTPATLGIRRTRFWPAVGWALAVYVGVIAAEGLWSLIVGGDGGASRESFEAAGAGEVVFLVAALTVVTPIAEELAFRGYLFAALTRWRGPWLAAILTGTLFGAAHIAVYPPEFLPALAVVGFGLCLIFWFTGSLLPCVGMHALNNAVVLAVALDIGAAGALVVVGAPAAAVALLGLLARERAPQPG